MANVDTSGESSPPCFYVLLPIIHELRVLILFTSFKTYFFNVINVAPSQITHNVWVILRAFQIAYCSLGMPPTVRVFLY